ncbi:MAG: sigma 54-interacting transcriptional regulator, partial [Desulfobacteraceae bacterium]|nr:sigma 54-interacting transcriptional regulator [Desulfobacteraceae bacterium]
KTIYTQTIDAEDRKGIWKTIDKCIKENQSFEVVYRLRTATGDYKWVWDKGEVLLGKDGTPILMEGFMMDITTFKHEEFRLQSFIRSASRERYRFGNIIGKSPEMQKIYEFISMATVSDASVIIYGESGTGKELVARAIHKAGKRKRGPLVIVNCGAISEKLLESEFFGYKKGAFTGASTDKEGFLAAAEGGTLFLDELGEISLEFQIKLLRVLDGHGYTPVGSNVTKKTDIRIIAATNKNLEELVKKGKMRKDFFYRIHIIPIVVPPLRKRQRDIPLLVDHFLEKYQKSGSQVKLPTNIQEAMHAYNWPGNIRELENVVQRYVTLGKVEPFDSNQFDDTNTTPLPEINFKSVSGGFKEIIGDFEKQVLLKVLEKNKWRRDK